MRRLVWCSSAQFGLRPKLLWQVKDGRQVIRKSRPTQEGHLAEQVEVSSPLELSNSREKGKG